MQNIKLKVEGTRLLIEIDLTDSRGATEKNIIVATTKGDHGVFDTPLGAMKLQLYLTKPYSRK